MRTLTRLVLRLLPAVAAFSFGPPARAQSVLVVEYHHKPAVVRAVRGHHPCVEDHGKLVVASADRYAMKSVDEFLPIFISLRGVKVETNRTEIVGEASAINNEFKFQADFVSADPLDDVFLVLELMLADGSRSLFLQEIGHLDPRVPHHSSTVVPLASPLGESQYQLHVFVGGAEVFHSEQPFAYRESMLDRIVAKRTANRPDGPPAPFIGPTPEYPANLIEARIKGRAVLKLHILPNGAVLNPEVVSATDPAFGEAAIAALRQWRFYPRIKAGEPVTSTVSMPIDFVPPPDPKSKS